ncbi:MAG: hypothetical protein QXP96_04075, partial [Thermoproteota archaeon]
GGRHVSGVEWGGWFVSNLCPGSLAASSPHPCPCRGLCAAASGRAASTQARKPREDGEKGPSTLWKPYYVA